MVIALIPALWSAYPLLVLPLLLAGPLAVHGLRLRHALGAAALAGLISGHDRGGLAGAGLGDPGRLVLDDDLGGRGAADAAAAPDHGAADRVPDLGAPGHPVLPAAAGRAARGGRLVPGAARAEARPDGQRRAAALAQRTAAAGVRHADADDDGARDDRLRDDRGDARPDAPDPAPRRLAAAARGRQVDAGRGAGGVPRRREPGRPGRPGGPHGAGRSDLPGDAVAGPAPRALGAAGGRRRRAERVPAGARRGAGGAPGVPRRRRRCHAGGRRRWSRRSRRWGRSSASSRRTWRRRWARAT